MHKNVVPCAMLGGLVGLALLFPAASLGADEKTEKPKTEEAKFDTVDQVTIKGTYQPVTPLLLFLPSSIPINITAVMGSEG